MTTEPQGHSYATLASLATLGFIVACVSHEAVGHGGMCVVLGGQVTLLSSVYFRCTNGGPVTDAAGPLMNLAVGALCWGILRGRASLSQHSRLFLVFALAFDLFWGAGYFVFSAVTNTGDWAFVLRDLALQPLWIWRCIMGVLGAYLYARSIQLVAFHLPAGTPLVLPYLVAGTVSCLAAIFFTGPTLPAVREAAQESFGASIGLLALAYRNAHQGGPTSPVVFLPRSTAWELAAALVTVAFIATLGRGFVFHGHA